MNGHMVQYSVLPNCTNNCKFCLRRDRRVLSTDEIISRIEDISENIDVVDWYNTFFKGISLLGGEVYGYTNRRYQLRYLLLVEKICDKILNICKDSKYSTVTNGIYNPSFLFECIDLIVQKASIHQVDVNFSYDIKYRFKDEHDRLLALSNINAFHCRYDYTVGVQMILTQYVIDSVLSKSWDMKSFIDKDIPGNQLVFLYPHPIRTKGLPLKDFFFKRNDYLKFLLYLEKHHFDIYLNTIYSTKYSSTFKYTGLFYPEKDNHQPPILADGKEILQDTCGHSVLYNCYSDSDKCMLCDIKKIHGNL